MKFTFRLFLSELKRTVFFLPRLLLCALVLIAFTAGVIYFGTRANDKNDIRVKIAYYNPNDDAYINMLINMVSEMDSVKSICTLEPVSKKQKVYDGIKTGRYYGGVIFPEDYIRSITDGTNEPATVIVPKGGNNAVFRQLVSVGSDMLVSVQAGIYASADGKKLSRTQLISINLEYVNFVLGRSKLFAKEDWSPYGSLSLAQYYCIMALSLLTMLIGTGLSFMFYEYADGFKAYGRLWGYNGVFMLLLKQMLVFAVSAGVTLPALMLADKYIPVVDMNYLMIFSAIFLSSEVITCFYTVFGGSASVLLAGFTAVTGFFSGCFVPLVYLSDAGLDKLCVYMPIYKTVECFSTLYTYRAQNANILPTVLAVYALTFAVCAVKRRLSE